MFVSVPSTEDGSQGGSAKRRGDIPPGVGQGLPGQLVQMGSLYVGVAEEGIVAPSLVIRDDEEDVWPADIICAGGIGSGGKAAGNGQEEQKSGHGRGRTVRESPGDGNPGSLIGEHFLYSSRLTLTLLS